MTGERTKGFSALRRSAFEQCREHQTVALAPGDLDRRQMRRAGRLDAGLDPARVAVLDVAEEGDLGRGVMVQGRCDGRVCGLERRLDENHPRVVVVAVVEQGRVPEVRAQSPSARRRVGLGRRLGSRGEQNVDRPGTADRGGQDGVGLKRLDAGLDLIPAQPAVRGGADDVEATASCATVLPSARRVISQVMAPSREPRKRRSEQRTSTSMRWVPCAA